jgi:hypothetical protein
MFYPTNPLSVTHLKYEEIQIFELIANYIIFSSVFLLYLTSQYFLIFLFSDTSIYMYCGIRFTCLPDCAVSQTTGPLS